MKAYYLSILILLLSFSTSILVLAQDLDQDLKRMGEQYQKGGSFSADLSVEIQYSEDTPLQMHQKATIRKKENRFYYSIGKAQTVISERLLIMVNEGNKSIFFRELETKEQEAMVKKYYQTGIDSVVSRYDSAVYAGVEKSGKHYVIYSAKKMISKTDLYIDESTGFVNKVVYGYNKKLSKDLYKIVISFAYHDPTAVDEALLKEETYLVKTGAQYKPAQKYLNYELNKVDNE